VGGPRDTSVSDSVYIDGCLLNLLPLSYARFLFSVFENLRYFDMAVWDFIYVADALQINKPHLAYTILGGFTSIFMLCSLFIKEKLYIGEASEYW
jgi:hypothetical protein